MTTDSTAKRPTNVRHFVLAALCLITVVNYVQRNAIGGAETRIVEDLKIERVDTGDANSDFFLAYSLCQIPSGWVAQRWGGRRVLTCYAATWSLMAALTALAPDLLVLRLSRIFLGVFQAGIFPCSTMILASWYPVARRGFATAMLNSFMLIGSSLVSVLTGLLIEPLGWRPLFLLYAAPGVLWALWFPWWFRDRPSEHPGINGAELLLLDRNTSANAPKDGKRARVPWLRIILSLTLWLICIQQFCRAGALRFFDQTMPTYLQQVRHQEIKEANLWTSVPLIGGVVGGLVGGILSDWVLLRTGSRRAARQGVALFSVSLALTCYCLAYRIADVTPAILVVSIGVFLTSFTSPVAYSLTMDVSGRNLAVIFAAMNMAGNLGVWAYLKFLPRVERAYGWDTALFCFAMMHVVAIVCWLLLNPNVVIGKSANRIEE